jgi:hypothetical protein
MPVPTRKHGRVEVSDAGAVLGWLELTPGEGNFTMSGLRPNQIEPIMVMNRGVPFERVEGDRVPVTGSLTVLMNGPLNSATNITILDMLLKRGLHASGAGTAASPAANQTTTDAGGVVPALQLRFQILRGAVMVAEVTLPDCTFSVDTAEAQAGNTMSINYENWALPIF